MCLSKLPITVSRDMLTRSSEFLWENTTSTCRLRDAQGGKGDKRGEEVCKEEIISVGRLVDIALTAVEIL